MKNHFEYRIYYEDTDAGGVVYYANYLKFLERARTDFLLSIGFFQSNLVRDGIFFVVKKCEIEYILPAKLEDIITVSCEIAKMGNTFIVFNQSISINGRNLVDAKIQVVCVKKAYDKFKPHKIPSELCDIIK
jgi:acyl-CoA thioester hydrolase